MARIFAAIYDSFMRRAEQACLAQWRAELLEGAGGEVLESNCHLTRRTGESIRAAGFVIERETRASVRKALPIVRPSIRGIARLGASVLDHPLGALAGTTPVGLFW